MVVSEKEEKEKEKKDEREGGGGRGGREPETIEEMLAHESLT